MGERGPSIRRARGVPPSPLCYAPRPAYGRTGINRASGPSKVAYYMHICYMDIMSYRTTLILDDETRKAARQLAALYDCSVSEAIRRAVTRHRDSVLGVPAKSRKQRQKALSRLIELFDGHDADEEVRRLKAEDAGF